MNRVVPLALAAAAVAAAFPAAACEPPAGFALRAESRNYQVFFRTNPGRIEVGRYFTVEAVVCAKSGGAAPAALKVDAQMPAHRHGMNSRATVEQSAPGRFLARGLMFHMPGVWQFAFDVQGAGGAERATRNLDLE